MNAPYGAEASSPTSRSAGTLTARLRGTGRDATSLHHARRVLLVAAALVVGLASGGAVASAAVPTTAMDSTSTALYTTAHVSGTVDPGGEDTYYSFEYSAEPATEGWSGFTFSGPVSGASQAVSVELTGLKPGTEYQVRLGALNAATEFVPVYSAEPNPTFTTAPVATPTLTLDPITTFTGTTAHFSGSVDSNAPSGPLTPAVMAAFKTEWHFQCTPECPGLAGVVPAGHSAQAVSADASRLEPNTTYEVSLLAANAGGTSTAGPESFHTPLLLAGVKLAPGGADGKGGYTLQGTVNPENSEVTDCHFEYGTTTDYGKSLPCQGTPGSADKPVEVTAHPTGLAPGSTYHFRLLATNGAGQAESSDGTFVASLASNEACPNEAIRAENNSLALPECRAYELASNGFTAGAAAFLRSASEDGSISFFTYAGDVANSGAGAAGTTYVDTRTSTGWEPLANLDGSSESVFASPEDFTICGCGAPEVFSTDLRSSIWYMGKAGESDNAIDFYLRRSDGSFALIGPSTDHSSVPPGAPGHQAEAIYDPLNYLIGTSADLSHLVYFGEGGGFGPGIWEYVGTGNTRPRHVDVTDAGSEISACGVPGLAASGEVSISTDGSVIVFAVSACGSSPAANEIWARVNGTSSYDISQSQCARSASDPGGVCNAPANATLGGTSTDGHVIYFTTTQQLVNGDTNETEDLYEAELPTASNPAPTLTEVSGSSQNAGVERVVNVSDDGTTVYFTAAGVLATNPDAFGEAAVAGDHNLYVWRRDASHPAGQTAFIGRLLSDDLTAQSTPDGRYLVLTTASPLVPGDTDSARDVYRYDADTGELLRLSTDTSGVGGNTEGLDAEITGLSIYSHRSRVAISDSGEDIVFSTSEALSPADVNGVSDAYLWHAGHISLVSTGRWPAAVSGAIIDGSGQNIYFTTNQALTPNDPDHAPDVYDAHVDGGFSFAQAAPCAGEGCLAPLSSPPPTFGAPESATLSSAGNPAPSVSVKPKPKPLTTAQKLAQALKACKREKSKHKRAACEAQARKRYGTKAKAKSRKGGK